MARILLSYVNSFMDNLIPLGASILSACLKQAGNEVDMFDTTFYRTRDETGDEARVKTLQVLPTNLEEFGIREKTKNLVQDFRKKIDEFNPDLIGLSVVESTYQIALGMLDGIIDYNIPKIMGGIHVTMCPDEVIKQDSLDMICVGEGEGAIVELADRISKKQDYSDVRNLWIKNKQIEQIIKNPLRPLADLDEIPMQDWSIYEEQRFLKPMGGKVWISGPLELDRGCMHRCAFCCNKRLQDLYKREGKGFYVRKKSIEKFIDELKTKKEKYGLEYLYLVAENFLHMSDERFNKFIELYKEHGLPFWIESRPETITLERIVKLNEVKCEGLSIGVEHGNEQFRRNTLNRYVSNEKIIKGFEEAKKSGIRVCANNILGFPTETRELVFDTIELNRTLKPDNVITNIFCAYRGTDLFNVSVEKGYLPPDSFAGDYRSDAELNMPQLTKQEIKGLQRTFPLYVYFPKSRWNEIRRAEKFDEKGNEMFEKLSKEYIAKYR